MKSRRLACGWSAPGHAALLLSAHGCLSDALCTRALWQPGAVAIQPPLDSQVRCNVVELFVFKEGVLMLVCVVCTEDVTQMHSVVLIPSS